LVDRLELRDNYANCDALGGVVCLEALFLYIDGELAVSKLGTYLRDNI
jgi:hypothetical protein